MYQIMSVYVCMYVCMYVCTCLYTYIHTYIKNAQSYTQCMQVNACTCKDAHMHLCIHNVHLLATFTYTKTHNVHQCACTYLCGVFSKLIDGQDLISNIFF